MSEEKNMTDAQENAATEGSAQNDASAQADNDAHPQLPQVNFSTFILSLASSALVQLGEVPNPENGKNEENPVLAKHTIDIIEMLQDKIKNGLAPEEEKLLEGILYELRMKYVIKVR